MLRKSFSFYLSPVLIEKMLASSALPKLGGETRIVTLYRSDLAGFSSMSEKLQANELVPLMNEYLTAMTDIIGRYGGFVDKYIGDAIDGVFGAPVDDPDHAANAVRAALAGQRQLRALNEAGLATFRGFKLRQRIGLHTGSALVGNIGSQQRFNYTAMGDTANLASRLEGANKFYGTSIIASEATMTLAKNAAIWRELELGAGGRAQPTGGDIRTDSGSRDGNAGTGRRLRCLRRGVEAMERSRICRRGQGLRPLRRPGSARIAVPGASAPFCPRATSGRLVCGPYARKQVANGRLMSAIDVVPCRHTAIGVVPGSKEFANEVSSAL